LERRQLGEFFDRGRLAERLGGQDVGADGDDELIGVIDQRGVEVARGGRAERGKHSLGEAVDSGDGGRIKPDHRPFESMEAPLMVLVGQGGKEFIAERLSGRSLEGGHGVGQAGAHAVA
jgi:hypothetical protein